MTPTTNVIDISEHDKVRVATNSPTLAKDEFTLGDKTYKIVDLSYDNYLLFMTHLGPLLEAVVGGVLSVQGMPISTGSITPKLILDHLAGSLPELACIVCNETDPEMTTSQVKKLGKTPFKLAEIVIKQIEHNKIIADIASFFAQMLPVIKTVVKLSR